MGNHSDTDSTQSLEDWEFLPPVDPEVITMVSVPTSPESDDGRSGAPMGVEKEIEIRVSESTTAGGYKEEAARRVLPPWMDPSWEWGGGKWKEDGRKKKKKESDEIPFKEIIEALLLNSGEKVEEEEEKGKSQSFVAMLKSKGLKFP